MRVVDAEEMPSRRPVTRLRPVAAGDLPRLLTLVHDADAAGEYLWVGHRVDRARHLERRWHDDGLIGEPQSYLSVTADDVLAGWVTWLPVVRSSGAIEIGIALFPGFRGRGVVMNK